MAEHQSFNMPYQIVHAVLLVVFSSLAMLAVALRFWARRIQKLALAVNDYLMLLGLVCNLLFLYSPFADEQSDFRTGREHSGHLLYVLCLTTDMILNRID